MAVIIFVLILAGVAFIILSTDILKKECQKAKRKRQVIKDLKAVGGMNKKYYYLIEYILHNYKGSKILSETDLTITVGSIAHEESKIFYLSQTVDSKLFIKYEKKNATRGQSLSWTFFDGLDQSTMREIIKKDITEKIETTTNSINRPTIEML